jgi:integrase
MRAAEQRTALPSRPADGEEIILVIRQAGPGPYADRTRGLIAILWRAGLRISEALALTETDLDSKTGSVLLRVGKGGKRRTVGMDDWAWEHVARWTEHRVQLPIGPLFCILAGRRAGAVGRQPLPAASFGGSPRKLGCDGGLRRTSSGMLMRSRWRTKVSRCRLSRGSSGMPISGSRRSTYKESTPATSSTRFTTADRR